MKKAVRRKVHHHHTNHVLWLTLIALAILAMGVIYNYQQMMLGMSYPPTSLEKLR